MDELKKLLENAGMGEGVMDYLTKGRAAPDIEPTDTVWTPEGTGTVVDGYQGRSGHYTSFDVEMLRSGEIKRFNIRDLKPMKPNVSEDESGDDDITSQLGMFEAELDESIDKIISAADQFSTSTAKQIRLAIKEILQDKANDVYHPEVEYLTRLPKSQGGDLPD